MFRFVLFYLFASSLTALAASFTPQEAAVYAARHNPTLQAARLRIEEARGRLNQSGRLSNPELEVELTRNFYTREGSTGAVLMQRFPVTARLRYQKQVSRAELAAAEAEFRDAERKLRAEVRLNATRLQALKSQRELRAKQLNTSRELAGFLTKRAQSGEVPSTDAAQVELEARQVEIESLQLATEEATLLGELRPVLGMPEGDLLITGELAKPLGIPTGGEVSARPDIMAARARDNAAQADVRQQRASRWEDVGVGAGYTLSRERDEPEPMENEHTFGVRFSIPLPLWNNSSGRIQEAEAAAMRARKEVDAALLMARGETAAALSEMRVLTKLLGELDSQVLPAAGRIEEQLRNNYSAGLIPLTDVLRARTRRLDLERSRIDALRDYQLALIRYQTATEKTPGVTGSSK